MTLDARRIALHGIGYGALFVALQGFAPAEAVEAPQAPVSGGAGASAPQRVPRAAVWPQREEEEILIIIAAALQIMETQ